MANLVHLSQVVSAVGDLEARVAKLEAALRAPTAEPEVAPVAYPKKATGNKVKLETS